MFRNGLSTRTLSMDQNMVETRVDEQLEGDRTALD
jgi:hypothetical protein